MPVRSGGSGDTKASRLRAAAAGALLTAGAGAVLRRMRLQRAQGAFGRHVPREAGRLFQAVAAQLLLHGRVGEYAANLVRYRLRIGGVEHGVVIADHFGDAGVVGADDGAAADHRFQCRQAETLVQGREDEQACAAIQVDQRVVVDIHR